MSLIAEEQLKVYRDFSYLVIYYLRNSLTLCYPLIDKI